MIHYARGMGLIHAGKTGGRWQLKLTTLGRRVVAEDPYLSESVTLWLLHLLLCRRSTLADPATGLADAWFALFAEGGLRLGNRFDQTSYLAFLTERHGSKGYLKGLSGLVLRSYLEKTCFGPIHALSVDTSADPAIYFRHTAPDDRRYFPAYSACLFLIWDSLYPGHSQLAVDELFLQCRLPAVMNWERTTTHHWLDWMTDHGLIQLDRQTGGALALRLQETDRVIHGIYDELI
jgi:hypothetical protein